MSSVYGQARILAKELYAREGKIGALADCVYTHVFDAIDFDAMARFEAMLCGLLAEVGIQDPDGELAETIMRDAIVRAASDPERRIRRVPFGITKAEEKAAAFDAGCPFCVLEPARPELGDEDEHVDGECACCDMMAHDWRAQHAEELARAGLGPSGRAPAPAHGDRMS